MNFQSHIDNPIINRTNAALTDSDIVSDDIEIAYVDIMVDGTVLVSIDDNLSDEYNFSTVIGVVDMENVFPNVNKDDGDSCGDSRDLYIVIMLLALIITNDDDYIDRLDDAMTEQLLSDYNDE